MGTNLMRRVWGFQSYPSSKRLDRAGRVVQKFFRETLLRLIKEVTSPHGGSVAQQALPGGTGTGCPWDGPSQQETIRGQGALDRHLMEEQDGELPGQGRLTCPGDVTQQQGKLGCAQGRLGSRVVNWMYQLDWTTGCSDFWLNLTRDVSGWD